MSAGDGDPVPGVHHDGQPGHGGDLGVRQGLGHGGIDVVGNVTVRNEGDGLGQRQGRALLLREELGLPLGREHGEPLNGLPTIERDAHMHVEAECAAVDLRWPDLH